MTHLSSEMAGRIRGSVKQWWQCRMHECRHCCQCDCLVTASDSFCPNCGQRNPARLALSAVLYPVFGIGLTAAAVWMLILAL